MRVQHYWPEGCCSSSRGTVAKFYKEVRGALFLLVLRLWQRHRWTGAHFSISWIGLGASLNGLLEVATPVWMQCCASGDPPKLAAFALPTCELGRDQLKRLGSRGFKTTGKKKPAALAPGQVDFKELNECTRVDAVAFARGQPQPHLLVLAKIMDPLHHMLHLSLTSEKEHNRKEQRRRVLANGASK